MPLLLWLIVDLFLRSEWFELTKAQHRALLSNQPEAIIVKIEELYPNTPDEGQPVRLNFSLFTELTREFVLEENKQEKQAERYHDKRPLEEIKGKDYQSKSVSLEEMYISKESLARFKESIHILTPIQRRRFEMYFENGLTLQQIADREGVCTQAVHCSIHNAKEKLKKYFSYDWKNRVFLSD